MRLKITTLSSVFFLCSLLTFSQQGALDPTFGIDGIVITDLVGEGRMDYAEAVLQQADGKILITDTGL